MPFQNVVEILLYIVPGFLALRIYRARVPIKQHSDFYDIAASIVFSVPLVVLIRWIDQRALRGSLHTDASFPYLRFVLVLLGTGLLAGLILIAIHELRFRLPLRWPQLSAVSPDPQSIWARLNQPWSTDWAVVFLDDGAIYRGWILEYTYDPDREDQDFLLSDATRVDENLKELYSIKGTGVYLNTRNVRRIEFIAGE